MVSQVGGSGLSPQVLRLLGMSGNNLNNSLSALASGNRLTSASTDVAAMSTATGMQSELSSLRSASKNFAQMDSLTQVASDSLSQMSGQLERMQALSVQANSGALDEGSRAGIKAEFDALREDVNRIASQSNFNGNPLLDGTFSDTSLEQGSLEIGDVRGGALALGSDVNLDDTDGAAAAMDRVKAAITQVTEQRANVGAYQERLDITSVSIDTAIQNYEAARAELQDTDIAAASTEKASNLVKYQSGIASVAQGNKLQGNLLKLIAG